VLLPRALKADLALGVITLIWGATFVVIKMALDDASPLMFVSLRFTLATALLLAIFARRAPLWDAGLARAGGIIGIFLCAGFVFQTIGMQYTTPAKSAFITALSVVLVPVVLVVLFGRRLRPLTVLGVLAAAAGMYLLTIPAGEFRIGRGDFITFLCALAFAGHIVAVGHYAPRHSVGGLVVWQVAVTLALVAVATPLAGLSGLEDVRLHWTPSLVFAVLLSAGLGIAFAFSVQTWAQQFTSPTHTAIIYSLEPVFAALFSYLILEERLGPRALVGAGLILAGLILAELRSAAAPDIPGMPVPANPSGEDSV